MKQTVRFGELNYGATFTFVAPIGDTVILKKISDDMAIDITEVTYKYKFKYTDMVTVNIVLEDK